MLCGGILIFQGWRLDPILLLCQILSSGTAIFFIGESLWLRNVNVKNRNPFKNYNKFQESLILNNSTKLKKISVSFINKYSCEEMKILFKKKKLCWETVSYTQPIDYEK